MKPRNTISKIFYCSYCYFFKHGFVLHRAIALFCLKKKGALVKNQNKDNNNN